MTNRERYKNDMRLMLHSYSGLIDQPSPLGCCGGEVCEKEKCALFILAQKQGKTLGNGVLESIVDCANHWLNFDRDSEEGQEAMRIAIERRTEAANG